jgi:hypothetical protein
MLIRFRHFLPIVLLGATVACSSNSQSEATATANATAAQRRQAIAQLRIPFANPVLLDSSALVLYPLPLHELVTEQNSSYGSSGYSRQDTYWNILFHNTRSTETYLLDTSRKMVIQSYYISEAYGNRIDNDAEASSNKNSALSITDRLIFYSVTLADTNRDGDLTSDDATYLFTSDKAGKDFRQISPDSLHVTNWEIQKSTGKVLLQTTRDSDHNRQFGNEDEVIPYLYDPATRQPASRLFAPAIIKQVKTVFQSKWENTPKK